MDKLFGGIFFLVLFFILVPPAHAFIFLPALILIPIAQFVAVIIGGFSLPAMGIGVLWSKLTGKSLHKGIAFAVSFLIIAAIVVIVVLKLLSPDRPFI